MANPLFNSVKIKTPRRSKFDLSHERKVSFQQGSLVPCFVQEVLPGDSMRVKPEIFLRVAPLLAPIMHRVNVRVEYFFVPNRIIWDEWESFITGGVDGESAPVHPYLELSDLIPVSRCDVGTLYDFMGLPTYGPSAMIVDDARISALPFRAYQQVYNDYYRDQNLQDEIEFSKGSGIMSSNPTDISTHMSLRTRCWEKDYYTSALPFAQRGPEVLTPVSVRVDQVRVQATDAVPVTGIGDPISYDNTGQVILNPDSAPIPGYIEGDNAASSINDLRRAYALQRWYEKAARVGSRYVEQLKGFFGVTPSDSRLQRAEWLGGGKAPIMINEVLSTVQLFDETSDPVGYPQGNMAGHGVAAQNVGGFKRSFNEHGWIVGIISVLPVTAYQQGIHREFQRFDRFDYAWPEFANIGEQAVRSSEVYFNPGDNAGTGESLFGYQSRYADYKFKESKVCGAFRESLAYWHMGRIFEGTPELNSDFVMADPTTRVYAVTGSLSPDVAQVYAQLYHRVDALRPLPYYGTPI